LEELEQEIFGLEKQVEKPYKHNKDTPYSLHAIMIHDGLAENGHYYTYVKDRKMNQWWCLNDHKVTLVEEAVVMSEALSTASKYKSACNLFYISQKLVEIIGF